MYKSNINNFLFECIWHLWKKWKYGVHSAFSNFWFLISMIQLILITFYLYCNPVVLKKILVKPLPIVILRPNSHKKGSTMHELHTKWKTITFAEITKIYDKLSKAFCFLKISYVLIKFMNLFLFWVLFFSEKRSF